MLRILQSLFLVAGLLFSSLLWAAVGHVQEMYGDVRAVMAGASPRQLAKNDGLENGMTISTGESSHVVLKFEDGQLIALKANSSFKIANYRYNPAKPEEGNIVFSFLKGGLRAITGLIAKNNHNAFMLQTPAATIGIRGTDFMAVTGSLYLSVVQGMVTATNAAGTLSYTAGQMAFVASAAAAPTAIAAAQLPAAVSASFSQLGSIPMAGAAGTGASTGASSSASTGASTGTTAGTTGATGASAGTTAAGTSATAAGGAAAGAGAAAGTAVAGATAGALGTGAMIGIGAAVAGVAAAGSGGGSTTTTHH